MNNEVKEKEINVSAFFKVLKKNLLMLCIITLVVAILAGAYSLITRKTTYSATVEFNVVNALSSTEYTTDSMLNAAASIASLCVESATKNVILKDAVKEFNLVEELKLSGESETVEYLAHSISAEKTDPESTIFSITVTTLDRDETFKIIDAIQETLPDSITKLTTSRDDSLNAATLRPVTSVSNSEDVKESTPSWVKNSVMAAAVAFVTAYIVCFIIFVVDTKVYNEESLKSKFNYPIIGSIPQWISGADKEAKKLSRKKLLRRDVEKSNRNYSEKLLSQSTPFAITESFNLLRTNLCYSVSSDKAPVFAVTSDFSGVGKSLISANVALSFAMLGKKTLLVEGDMRCPDFGRIFEKKSEIGLSEILSGNLPENADPIIKREGADLSVIFSGRIPPNPSELLGSKKMAELVEKWKSEYDVVIIDLPPVFEVADASVISSLVSGYVLVARSDHSDLNALASSVEILGKVHANIAGFVINDVDLKDTERGYYTKYGKYKKYSAYSSRAKEDNA